MFFDVNMETTTLKGPNGRTRLLDAAITLMRKQGYTATSVDELCAAAGVTKGAFFHHFPSKEALGAEAAHRWSETTGAMFASAAYHQRADPLERFMAYIDLRLALINGPPEAFTCYVGTVVQETFAASESIREACRASIWGHARTLEADIAEALAEHGVEGVTARSLALHSQAVLQGAFILAKASGDPAVAVESVIHLKRYICRLFGLPEDQWLKFPALP